MATSKAYDVENERMNPSNGGGVAGKNQRRRTPLMVSPTDLDTDVTLRRSGAAGSNRAAGQSPVTGYDSHSK